MNLNFLIGENLSSNAFLCISLFQDELLPLNISDLETDQEPNSLCSATEGFYLVTPLVSDMSEGHCKPRISRTENICITLLSVL